jgi:hypothetical protein
MGGGLIMQTFTIITLTDKGMSYAYVGEFKKMPTFAQAKKMILKTGHQVSSVLAIVETVPRGLVSSSGMAFGLDSLVEAF